MNTVFAHIFDPQNLGDSVCCPADYFPEFDSCRRANLWDSLEPFQNSNLIIGGGGVIHGDLESKLSAIPVNGRKLIAWGIGHNQHFRTMRRLCSDDYFSLRNFSLVGCRDWNTCGASYIYVPCASCLHNEFSLQRSGPKFDYVIYEHRLHPIPIGTPLKMSNSQAKFSFASVLDFLSSGQTVITNTFHGAYWSMLLNRRVILWNPFSTRFHTFKHQPEICDETNWSQKVRSGPTNCNADYLADCRAANMAFFGKVKEVIF